MLKHGCAHHSYVHLPCCVEIEKDNPKFAHYGIVWKGKEPAEKTRWVLEVAYHEYARSRPDLPAELGCLKRPRHYDEDLNYLFYLWKQASHIYDVPTGLAMQVQA